MSEKHVLAALLAVCVLGTQAFAKEQGPITPWPPVTIDRHAPENWPVPAPAPAVDLNRIPSGIVFRNLSLTERKAVQKSLAAVGYYHGNIDGVWGPLTWTGTRNYAASLGLVRDLDNVHGSLRLFQHITN